MHYCIYMHYLCTYIIYCLGYLSDITCSSDIDECATDDHTCDVNADCSNTNGSFTCSCISGYSGDGMTCSGWFNCSCDHNISYIVHTCMFTQLFGAYII